jgi:hypothetical protein
LATSLQQPVVTGRETERAAAGTSSEALGGLPLAHEQAAAHCERLTIMLAEYHKRFEAAPGRSLLARLRRDGTRSLSWRTYRV